MLFVSLVGDAKIVVPDSMLNIRKSYLYFITSPDTAQAIIETIRKRKLAPEWEIEYAEGNLYFNQRRYLTAVSIYKKIDVSNCIIFGNLSGILGANVETSSDAHGDGSHGILLICA